MENNSKDWRDIMKSMAKKPSEGQQEIKSQEPTQEEVTTPSDEAIEDENATQDQQVEVSLNEETEPVVDDEKQKQEVSTQETSESQSEDGDSIIDDWASDDVVDNNEDSSNKDIDLSSIASEIGIDHDGSLPKNEFLNKIKEKISSYEQQIEDAKNSSIPENLPDNLKEAIKVAAEGGNYEAYLNVSSVNYDSISNEDLVANMLAENFLDDSGNVNNDELYEYMDTLSDAQIKIEGNKIRNSLKQNSEIQKQNILKEASEKRKRVINEVNAALKEVNDIAGFKIQGHQKDLVRKAIENDRIITDMFYKDGRFDGKKAVEAYLKTRYFDKMISYLKNSTRTETKKEILKEVTNAEVTPSVTPTNPRVEQPNPITSWIEKMKQGNK